MVQQVLAVLKERVQAVARDALHTMRHRSAVPLVRVCMSLLCTL